MAVKPGDPILKHLTAGWFNRVDQATLPQRRTGESAAVPDFNRLEIKVLNYAGNVSYRKYTAVPLGDPHFNYGKLFDLTHNVIVLDVKNESEPITDPNNWAVLQEPLTLHGGPPVLALLKGITWIQCPTSQITGNPSSRFLQVKEPEHLHYSGTGRAEIILKTEVTGDDVPRTYFLVNMGSVGGSSIKYFVLAEDAVQTPVYAWPGVRDSGGGIVADIEAPEPFLLHFWEDVIRTPKMAKAGYTGIYGLDEVGFDSFINGPCITGCQTTATIEFDDGEIPPSANTLPPGEQGTSYSYTITITGLNASGISAIGLPAGLSLNATTGAITGTPATPGTYWVTLFANSDDDPPCELTRLAKIVIWATGTGPWEVSA